MSKVAIYCHGKKMTVSTNNIGQLVCQLNIKINKFYKKWDDLYNLGLGKYFSNNTKNNRKEKFWKTEYIILRTLYYGGNDRIFDHVIFLFQNNSMEKTEYK